MSAVGERPRTHSRRLSVPRQRARRVLFLLLVGGTGLAGTGLMFGIVAGGGVTLLEILILALFVPTFLWISISFWNAVIGFTLLAAGRHALTLESTRKPREGSSALLAPDDPREGAAERALGFLAGPLRTRTALVVPVRDEPMDRVLGALDGMLEGLEATGYAAAFDVHLLSDTTDPARAAPEEAVWEAFRCARMGDVGLHYRRRHVNEGRKAGNIQEFCRRCSGHYDFMVVLDADSVMTGETLLELVRAMEANPRAGLIQTVPLPARQRTRFGRLIQLAATLHSRVLATGQSFWQGDAANYWGHNAIVRLDAFERHARLPLLPGRPPLGGEILSHDFVEAALIRRAGWHVYLLPELEGSYEEVPGNIPDFAARDRRWAQGSLQHLRLLGMAGLHPLSRVHFVLGAMGYVSSVLWLALLLTGSVYVLWPAASGGPALGEATWLLSAGRLELVGVVSLLGLTAVLLFLPKALGVAASALDGTRPFGGAGRMLGSAVAEAASAVVIAPVMMMYHVRAVLGVLWGREVAWGAHAREGRRISWDEAVRGTAWITLTGVAWATATAWLSFPFLVWLSPILLGLVLVAPIVRWSSETARASDWLAVPHETAPPRELLRAMGRRAAPMPTPHVSGAQAPAWRAPHASSTATMRASPSESGT